MVLEIDDQSFEALVLKKSKPTVIDFYAPWCGPCKMVSPVMEVLAEEYEEQVIIGKVDVDTNTEWTAKYGVRNMPTVLFLKDGEVVDKLVGAATKKVYEEKLKALL